ncbi:MAG: sodium:solute symporter family protein [Bdellovibrionales bacterium]|nr:sodium:solute symporter family protein [Bdellovibrionales bacterium]
MEPLSPSLNLLDHLNILDWIVFTLVLLATFAAVIWGQIKKNREIPTDDEELNFLDLLLMGRRLTLPMFVATLVATWYGGIFGVTQIAFEQGIYNFVTQGLFWYLAYIVFALFLVHKIAPYNAVTLPDLVNKMFGPRSAKVAALFNFFNVLPVAYVISLGLFLQSLFGWSMNLSMMIGVAIVISYSLSGGFRAVVFSDIVQFSVMVSSVLLVALLSVSTFGLETLTTHLPAGHFHPMGENSLSTTLVWGFIALSTLVDPNFYQRCFAAESESAARKGILISTGIWFLFDICTTMGGMYARATIPEANSGQAYLIYGLQILPPGLRGFFLGGILATILSTLDSYLFQAGTNLAYDLAPKKWKGKISIHHFGIIGVGLLSIILANVFDGNIKRVWKTLGSYSAACLLLPVMIGHLFPKKISDKQFVIACAVGVIGTTYWRNASHIGFWADVDELYIGMLCTAIVLVPTMRKKIDENPANDS